MAIAFWDDQEVGYRGSDYLSNPHDTLFLGTKKLGTIQVPGLVSVKITRAVRVTKQKATGRDGATKIIRGMEPAKVEVLITVWTPRQYRLLNTLRNIIFPPEGKKSTNDTIVLDGVVVRVDNTPRTQAFDIRHPECDAMGIRSVVPLSTTSMTAGTKGERSISITFESHHKPPKGSATRKVEGSTSGNKKLVGPLEEAKQASFSSAPMVSEARKPLG